MIDKNDYFESSINADNRKFSIRIIKFDNGAFVSISEGDSPRIGSMVVSIATSNLPVSTSVIPAKTGSIFLKLVAEMVSSRTRGIATVTIFAASEISSEATRSIMSKIMEMI